MLEIFSDDDVGVIIFAERDGRGIPGSIKPILSVFGFSGQKQGGGAGGG